MKCWPISWPEDWKTFDALFRVSKECQHEGNTGIIIHVQGGLGYALENVCDVTKSNLRLEFSRVFFGALKMIKC